MYSVVLMAALSAGANEPSCWGWRRGTRPRGVGGGGRGAGAGRPARPRPPGRRRAPRCGAPGRWWRDAAAGAAGPRPEEEVAAWGVEHRVIAEASHGRAEQAERHELLERALASLAQPYRTVVVLRDIEDLSYEEITRVLGVAEGTVKSRLVRGRELLRRKFAAYLAR